VVLSGKVKGSHQVGGSLPVGMTVEQISAATGQRLRVLYRRTLGPTSQLIAAPNILALSADGAGRHWLLNGAITGGSGHQSGFNGWIDSGRLVPLRPSDGLPPARPGEPAGS
jgi:hypothetical protein